MRGCEGFLGFYFFSLHVPKEGLFDVSTSIDTLILIFKGTEHLLRVGEFELDNSLCSV